MQGAVRLTMEGTKALGAFLQSQIGYNPGHFLEKSAGHFRRMIPLAWPAQRQWRLTLSALAVTVLCLLFLSEPVFHMTTSEHHRPTVSVDLAQHFVDHPLYPPYKDVFGYLGRRCRALTEWLAEADRLKHSASKAPYIEAAEKAALFHFPFLSNPSDQSSLHTPVTNLRASFRHGSAGIVIPCGTGTVRFAAQLVLSLRHVLKTELPIQIAHAGDADLPPEDREELLLALGPTSKTVEFFDVTSVFDHPSLELAGSWAVKSFAVLASRLERVILIDADAVFLQKPDVLLSHPGFLAEGALLFHDRLLWQHAFLDRHQWYHSQIANASASLNKSLVWTEEFAEEQDSGVVVVDKSRVDVLVGLLHICWQNTKAVREEVTYKITYGDKESWWLGFELAGSGYQFEQHYGAIVGWEDRDDEGNEKVCSFVIAHLDAQERLLWYNGGLLKNKMLSNEYSVPQKWMVDAQWQKGAQKQDMSCMVGGQPNDLTDEEKSVLGQSIMQARAVDGMLGYPIEAVESHDHE